MDVAFSCMINFLLKVLAFLYTYNYTGTHFRQHTVFYCIMYGEKRPS